MRSKNAKNCVCIVLASIWMFGSYGSLVHMDVWFPPIFVMSNTKAEVWMQDRQQRCILFFWYMCRILARLIDRHRNLRTKHTHFFSLLFIFDLRINNLMIMFNVYHIHFSLHFCVVLARCFICLCHGNICIPLKIVVWLVRFVSRLHRIYQCLIWDYCRFLSCSSQYHVGN